MGFEHDMEDLQIFIFWLHDVKCSCLEVVFFGVDLFCFVLLCLEVILPLPGVSAYVKGWGTRKYGWSWMKSFQVSIVYEIVVYSIR